MKRQEQSGKRTLLLVSLGSRVVCFGPSFRRFPSDFFLNAMASSPVVIGRLDLGEAPIAVSDSVAKDTFKQLADKYGFDAKIADKITGLGFKSLHEFAKIPRDKLEVLLVTPAQLGELPPCELARGDFAK